MSPIYSIHVISYNYANKQEKDDSFSWRGCSVLIHAYSWTQIILDSYDHAFNTFSLLPCIYFNANTKYSRLSSVMFFVRLDLVNYNTSSQLLKWTTCKRYNSIIISCQLHKSRHMMLENNEWGDLLSVDSSSIYQYNKYMHSW